MSRDLLGFAATARKLGFPTIPCEIGGKNPSVKWKRFQDELPTDEALRIWFGGEINDRTRNVILVLGKASDVVVVDVDAYKDPTSEDWARRNLPETPLVVRTGGGGLHLYYKRPDLEAVPNRMVVWDRERDQKLAIEFKADRGYVLAPGSIHAKSGNYYVVEKGSFDRKTLDELPVFDPDVHLTRKPSAPAPQPSKIQRTADVERARSYLASCSPSISGQNGDTALFKAAVAMRKGFGLEADVAVALLASDFNPRCSPPWSEERLRYKVEEAEGATQPWGYLRDVPSREASEPTTGTGVDLSGIVANFETVKPEPKDEAEHWGPLVPLSRDILHDISLDPFKRIPWFQDLVRSIGRVVDVPYAPVVLAGLGACSAAWADNLWIDTGQYTSATNLFVLTLMESGGGKSVSIGLMTSFLADRFKWEDNRMRWREMQRLAGLRMAERDRRRAEKAEANEETQASLASAIDRCQTFKQPLLHERLHEDVTPARIVQIMGRGCPHVVVIDPEGVSIERASGSRGRGADLLPYKSGWSREAIRRGRVKDDEHGDIEKPCLTLIAALQPEKMRVLGRDAGATYRGEGFLARILPSMVPDRVGNRKRPTRNRVSEDLLLRWSGRLEQVRGSMQESSKRTFTLELTDRAFETWADACVYFDRTVNEWPILRDWLTRGGEHSARLAAHLHLLEQGAAGLSEPIDADTMASAVELVREFFFPNVAAVCGLMVEAPGEAEMYGLAREVAKWLEKRDPSKLLTARHVSRGPKAARDSNMGAIYDAMEILQDHGYVEGVGQRQRGRRRVPTHYKIRPDLGKGEGES